MWGLRTQFGKRQKKNCSGVANKQSITTFGAENWQSGRMHRS